MMNSEHGLELEWCGMQQRWLVTQWEEDADGFLIMFVDRAFRTEDEARQAFPQAVYTGSNEVDTNHCREIR